MFLRLIIFLSITIKPAEPSSNIFISFISTSLFYRLAKSHLYFLSVLFAPLFFLFFHQVLGPLVPVLLAHLEIISIVQPEVNLPTCA
jgi:hypothetical protein